MNRKTDKIDFVIAWVDGSDPAWQAEKEKYAPHQGDNSASPNRFRDWGLLPYWFRGVEQYAPWVNHIYFVTCGHYPGWLNLDHPKLTLVRHEDYIPQEYLPTFNSNTILLNLHRIRELQEHFVQFNDDVFLIRPVAPEDFFRCGLPCDAALLDTAVSWDIRDVFPHMMLNNGAIINRHFCKKEVLRRTWTLFFSRQYSAQELLRNALLAPLKYFSCFRGRHLPASYTKSAFCEVWSQEEHVLAETCTHRFRSATDVTDWIFRDWQICQGNMAPRSHKWGRHFELGRDNRNICDAIRKRRYTAVCLNDSAEEIDFEQTKAQLIAAFEEILPERSSYEI